MNGQKHHEEPQVQPDVTLDLCVPVLQRTEDLHRLFLSVPEWVDTVHVADNGPAEADRTHVYGGEYPFELDVIDLPFDVGIGRSRRAAAAASDAEYVVVCDNDMELPGNLETLVEILEADPSLGGVGGILDEHGSLRSGCCNLHDTTWWRGGTALVQTINDPPTTEWVAGHPIARFDKLANAMVVRQRCIADYSWDDSMVDREHLDWFVAHWQETDWEFAVCPEVVFRHHTGGPETYEQQYRHGNTERQERTLVEFCEKWGYDRVVTGDTRWFGTARRPIAERVANEALRHAPPRVVLPLKDAAKMVLST